jgi:hypothetical protein
MFVPSPGKTKMSLHLKIPYTFYNSDNEKVIKSGSFPFITKKSSADLLNSIPCYKNGEGPGNYSLECLQTTFLNSGCEQKGTMYPNNMNELGKFSRSKTIAQIGEEVSELSKIAATGRNNSGTLLPIQQINDAAMKCIGTSVGNACTFEGNGRHGAECLDYLWSNQGATDTSKTSLGRTYTSGATCQKIGGLSPIAMNGTINTNAVNFWNNLATGTSIDSIKSAMNAMSTDARYLYECKGIKPTPPPPPPPLPRLAVPLSPVNPPLPPPPEPPLPGVTP